MNREMRRKMRNEVLYEIAPGFKDYIDRLREGLQSTSDAIASNLLKYYDSRVISYIGRVADTDKALSGMTQEERDSFQDAKAIELYKNVIDMYTILRFKNRKEEDLVWEEKIQKLEE